MELKENAPFREAIKGEVNKGIFPPLPKLPPKEKQYFPTANEIETFRKVKPFFPDGTPKYSEEEKEELINKWNSNPKVEKNGIGAIDTEKETPIKKRKYNWLVFLAIVGVIAVIGILAIGGVFGYLA